MYSFVYVLWRMVAYCFEMVISKRFKVKLWYFHNDMESNEMNNANLNFNLKGKQPAVNSFTVNSGKVLQESNVI